MDLLLVMKRTNDEIKADRPTIDELRFIPKTPIYFFLENITLFDSPIDLFHSRRIGENPDYEINQYDQSLTIIKSDGILNEDLRPEEFDIEDDSYNPGNRISEDLQDSTDDTKFNTEKHHKKQHKF